MLCNDVRNHLKIKNPYLTSLIVKQTTLAHELFYDITISLTDTYLPSTTSFSSSDWKSENAYFISGKASRDEINGMFKTKI